MNQPLEPLKNSLAAQEAVQVLVFSDSHGHTDFMGRVSRRFPGCDLILHLGDHCASLNDLSLLLKKPVLGVYGNCDGHFARHLPAQQLLVLAGQRVFLAHGHQFGVKHQLNTLLAAGSNAPYLADVILFGHTHRYYEKSILADGRPVILLNPGSARPGSFETPASAALMNISRSGISCELLLDQT